MSENEEIDDSEFYHQDFTTATEWEVFIARLEEVIQAWKSNRNPHEPNEGTWIVQSERVPFADVEFTFTHFQKLEPLPEPLPEQEVTEEMVKNPIDTSFDIERNLSLDAPESCLALWYGLKEYFVLVPVDNSGITSESRIKILLSSVHIVAGNTNCFVPIFVQIREKWQKLYVGVFEGEGVRTSFHMVHLRKGPQHCQYLSGLLDLFKTKIMSPVSLDPICVSVQITYILSEFANYIWRQDLPDIESDNFDNSSLCSLPFGVTLDPITALVFKATWSRLPEHLIVDTETYSDFDPMQAQRWSVQTKATDTCICLLSDCLFEFMHLFTNSANMYSILGDFAVSASDLSNPLDLLTESKVPTISSVFKRAARNSLTKGRRTVAPLSEEVLVPMLYFLFPDAEDNPKFPYLEKVQEKELACGEDDGEIPNLEKLCRGFKTCAVDTVIWRLAVVMGQSLHSLGGIRALAHIWFEFSQEMRYRWEKSIPIPGLDSGFPDPRTCLLHQKLQMLNCCIDRRKARESSTNTSTAFESAEDSSTDEEEFFDCTDRAAEEASRKKHKHSLWNQPVGRLGKFGSLKLLQTGEQMYVPATQEPVPKTEDQLEEDTNVLMKLGSDAQGSEMRAKMMSASLLSDMESFKAANPGAVLEDFIRWYSPRDWVEEDGEDEWGQPRGHLSSRMLISDNTWVQMWQSAKPVPAHRQKRLFDDTREAEKVLHWLDSRCMSHLADLLVPVLAQAAIYVLVEEWQQVRLEIPDAFQQITRLTKTAERLSREGTPSPRRFELFTQEVYTLELTISKAKSLLYKFNPQGEPDERLSASVADLVKGREVDVADKVESKIATRMTDMFSTAQKMASLVGGEGGFEMGGNVFPQASEREFVMRVSAVRPAVYSVKSPQFLRAVLSKGEFRLVGAFSEDTVFF